MSVPIPLYNVITSVFVIYFCTFLAIDVYSDTMVFPIFLPPQKKIQIIIKKQSFFFYFIKIKKRQISSSDALVNLV